MKKKSLAVQFLPWSHSLDTPALDSSLGLKPDSPPHLHLVASPTCLHHMQKLLSTQSRGISQKPNNHRNNPIH